MNLFNMLICVVSEKADLVRQVDDLSMLKDDLTLEVSSYRYLTKVVMLFW